MGARTPDTVKQEIATLRAGLDGKLTELEGRLPPLLRTAKIAAVALAGGSGSGLLLFLWRRLRRAGRKRADRASAARSGVVVQVLPSGAIPIALALAAIWAGVRVFEARMRAQEGRRRGEAPVSRLRAS